MKIQKIIFSYLTIVAVIMSLLLGARAAQADQTDPCPGAPCEIVTDDNGNVIQILELPVTDQFGDVTVYNVDFMETTAVDLYGPGLDFDFFDADDAGLGMITVFEILNLANPVPPGAGRGGSDQFFIGGDDQDLDLIGAWGAEIFSGVWELCDPDSPGVECILGVAALPQDELFTYAHFTPVNGCIPETQCSAGSECGTEPDGCGGENDCGECDAGESCVGNICEPGLPNGDWAYCDDKLCQEGEGDCDGDEQCESGLTCVNDVGANYGWDPTIDVCEEGLPNGDWAYCDDKLCKDGEGDCDGDEQCESGLTCVKDVGANYGWDPTIDVCESGGSGLPNGDWAYCDDKLCKDGEGDCDGDEQCESGLTCVQDVGANYGWDPTIDVCESGGSGLPNGDWAYCDDKLCKDGEGDCDGDEQCESGLTCVEDAGADYGWDPTIDVCESGLPNGDWAYCDDKLCKDGEGDCDGDEQCESGLTCVEDAGANYGWDPTIDVCESDCIPATECLSWFECGEYSNGCGGSIDCGPCGTGESCVENICKAGCIPATECPVEFECGDYDDGCGDTIDCGPCGAGEDSCVENICIDDNLEEIIVEYCEEIAQDTTDAVERLSNAYLDMQECTVQYSNCLLDSIFSDPMDCLLDYFECLGRGLEDMGEACADFNENLVDATQRAAEEADQQGIEDEFIQWLYSPDGEECLSVAEDAYLFCTELTSDE